MGVVQRATAYPDPKRIIAIAGKGLMHACTMIGGSRLRPASTSGKRAGRGRPTKEAVGSSLEFCHALHYNALYKEKNR